MAKKILQATVVAIGIILGMVTFVTKSGTGIIILTFLFIVMTCAEIYWWSKYQTTLYELNIYKDLQAAWEAMDAKGMKISTPLDPACMCGHPQSEHGSIGVCLHVSNCKCVNFKQFRTVES